VHCVVGYQLLLRPILDAGVPHFALRVAPSFPCSLQEGWEANYANPAGLIFQLQFGIELSPLKVS